MKSSTPPRTGDVQSSSMQSVNRSLPSQSGAGGYSQSLDELLGLNSRPPVPVPRRLPDLNSTPPTGKSTASSTLNERPTTRHGSRSSSNNPTSSSSSDRAKEAGSGNSERSATKVTGIMKRPPLSPLSISAATNSVNVWTREEEEQGSRHESLDHMSSGSSDSGGSSGSGEDDFTKKLQNLANRTMQARNSIIASQTNSSTSNDTKRSSVGTNGAMVMNKKPSVIIEQGEGSQASSSNTSSSLTSPAVSKPNGFSMNKTNGAIPTAMSELPQVTDNGASERRRRRSNALRPSEQKPVIDINGNQKPEVYITPSLNRINSAVKRLSHPKIRSTSANAPAEGNKAKGKPWGSNIKATASSLSGFPSQLEGSGRAISSTTSSSYDAWLKQKLELDKEKKLKLKEKQEEEERKKKEKKLDAAKSFERWKEERDRKLAEEKIREKQKKVEQKEKERLEKEEKRANAEKTFEYWKKSQMQLLRRHRSQSALQEKRKANVTSAEKEAKKKEAERAYTEWLKENSKRKANETQKAMASEKELEEQRKQEKEYKEELANQAYHLWLEMKKEEDNYAKSLAHKILVFESEAKRRWPATPWLPTGNTVPRQFVGTGSRRKTIEKPLMLRHSAKRTPIRTQSVH